ncbi:MAG: Trk system potassium transporter TrkA [Planctomycetes bacterium]|nr:Trk system potassium transporter TrkA [Planctomycetota bacterium]
MKITISGEDNIAVRLAEALMHEHEVSLIVPKAVENPVFDSLNVQVFRGSQTSTKLLKEACIFDSDLFVACGKADETNLVACAEAKRMRANKVVCFLRGQAVQTNENDAAQLAHTLGIDKVVLPALRLAKEIQKIVMVPGALEADAFVNGKVRLVKRRIEKGSRFDNVYLKDVGVPEGVVLVMIERDDERFIPHGKSLLQAGDKLTAMGNIGGIERLIRRYMSDTSVGPAPRRAIIVGGGSVGFAIAESLEDHGWKLKIIESNRQRAEEIAGQLKGLVLHGDGTDLSLLREENVGDTPVLIAVTSNDEKNLLVSLLAKEEGVGRILTRAANHTNEQLFESVGIDVVRSTTGAAVNAVLRGVLRSEQDFLAEFNHGDVRILRLTLPEHFEPIELGSIQSPVFAIVGAILRSEKVLIPQGKDIIQAGDELLVFSQTSNVEQTRDFFENL